MVSVSVEKRSANSLANAQMNILIRLGKTSDTQTTGIKLTA